MSSSTPSTPAPVSAPPPAAAGLLAQAARLADAAMDQRLPASTEAPARLHAAMRYAVLGGGKRLRPALALGACRACGGSDAAAAPAMAALEFLHTYTLVHDDLPAMDDDDLRRGRPTVHKAYDDATAILVGDALQAAAFAAAAELGVEAVQALAHAAGSLGVVGGQQDDLEAEGRMGSEARADLPALLERIHQRKTAALLVASCQLGGIAAKASAAQLQALAAYGLAAGMAFQIADDILDVTSSAAVLGKTPGKDAASGKLTWVSLHGMETSQRHATELVQQAIAALTTFGPSAEPLRQLARYIIERQH